jgi:hypothetical protein
MTFLALPVAFWLILEPETFWHRLIMFLIFAVYTVFGGLVMAFLWWQGDDILERWK